MILENKRKKILSNHKNVFQLYKDLKKLLPSGYMKTRISKEPKYSIQMQSILSSLEKEKNKEIISPTKLTQKLFYNQSIYFYSGNNEDTKKFIKKLKIANKDNNNKNNIKTIPSNLLKDEKPKNNIKNNITLFNFKNNSKNISFNQKEDNISSDRKGPFKVTGINNCLMKNNIFLPSLTSRLKNKMPRFYRQNNGFLLEGIGKYSLKSLKSENNKTVNEYTNIDEDFYKIENNPFEAIKRIKKIKKENIKRNISSELDKMSISNDLKNKFKKFLKQNNITAKELKISGIKKIKKFET